MRGAETAFLAVGVLCTLVLVGAMVESSRAERAGQTIVSNTSGTGTDGTRRVVVRPDAQHDGSADVIGRLEISKLGISVPILSDYGTSSLLKGIGHVPGTAMPGGLGNLGLAGHRDTYFRPLRNIKRDMDIRVVDSGGVYHYLVDSTEVVTPNNVEVLDIRDRPELTLITCYPFYYVGSAPQRFIVHAHLVSALPEAK